MNILVTSPLPLPMGRDPSWGVGAVQYDSGDRQTSTTWVEPLYKYTFDIKNMPRSKQSSLHAFFNQQKGQATPFLMRDPYDFNLNMNVRSGVAIAAGSGFYLVKSSGFRVIGDPTNMLLFSAQSATLTQGSHYVHSLDNGFIRMVVAKNSADTYTMSCYHYRKVTFTGMSEQSFLWDSFTGNFSVSEMIVK